MSRKRDTSYLDRIRNFYRSNPNLVSSTFGRDKVDTKKWEDILSEFGIDIRGKRILDLGCGRGWLMEFAMEQGAEAWGVDISSFLPPKLTSFLTIARGEYLPFEEETFDFIFCIDSFEHMEKPDRVAQELRRVLKKGGGVFLSVPNYLNIAGLVKIWEEKMGFYAKDSWAPFGGWMKEEKESLVTPFIIRRSFAKAGFKKFLRKGEPEEIPLGVCPWILHPSFPYSLRVKFTSGDFQLIYKVLNKIFPDLSLHNFWLIQ